MKTYTINTYNFDELSENAKQNAIHEFYNDYNYLDIEYKNYRDGINFDLSGNFPNSYLNVTFDFSCTQGSGLNITGELNLFDFLDIWSRPEEEKNIILSYLEYCHYYELTKNDKYSYSCKFMDTDTLYQFIFDEMDYNDIEIPREHEKIINKFIKNLVEYFENLENMYYNDPVNDESIIDYIVNSDLEFSEEGRVIWSRT